MQENYNDKSTEGGESTLNKALSWLDNFWYHYKWHSIIALFLIFAVLICSLQMCSKASYDMHILYSGGHEIKRTSSNGDLNPYKSTLLSLGYVVSDYDEDGKVNISLSDLYMLTEDEIAALTEAGKTEEINYYLIGENSRILRDNLTYSNYYLCFLSPAVFEEYAKIDGVEIFAPISALVSTGSGVELYSTTAVRLSSTDFYSLPGICDLPDDTLVAIRQISDVSGFFNKTGTERDYNRAIETLKKIISYKIG